jgi:HPt (histidine-containing phosphotransfer) domain-containing protein
MIDWARVNALRLEIGADGFGEVVAMFLDETDEAMAGLLPGADARTLEGQLHFLKGTALNLGFADFAALCQAGERAPLQADIPAIRRSYAASRAAFEAGLRNPPVQQAG